MEHAPAAKSDFFAPLTPRNQRSAALIVLLRRSNPPLLWRASAWPGIMAQAECVQFVQLDRIVRNMQRRQFRVDLEAQRL
jgi:hypothetical protein